MEPKWQHHWRTQQPFRAVRRAGHPTLCALDMFPYPSGAGLHVGHPEGYTATDIVCRHARMKGFDVLHPMGWDSFGLPAEQHAINTGTHPSVTTRNNIDNFRRQLQALGFSYDWSRELATTDERYVRWTQWIFLKLFHRGLAFQAETPVNWCPALGTVLANEEVIDGRSERGSHPVVRMPLRQWTLKITAYADRLLDDLVGLDWPETREKQTHWIGRSEGAECDFAVVGHDAKIRVFTTRPDTMFGATYMVLAPEHPLVAQITTPAQKAAVDAYVLEVARKSDMERTALGKKKSGVPTGAFATNPATGQPIPVWVADFVLGHYGTGAIMSVPGHDERDFEFARVFGLPIVQVVSKDGALADAGTWKEAFVDDGVAVRSGFLDGKQTEAAKAAMIDWVEAQGLGTRKVQYKLRDWVFSRQRYWGEPIPVYFPVDLGAGVDDPRKGAHTIRYDQPIAVEESELPVRLPDLADFKPGDDPSGPLARALDWRFFQKDGRWFARETNTMPQWAGSCWYYLRFLDPHNDARIFDDAAYDDWMPVDLYVGGSEHAVLHLLYARFWHKVLFDCGVVKHKEPFQKLVHQGLILGEVEYTAYKDSHDAWVSPDDVEEDADHELRKKGTDLGVVVVKLRADQTQKKGGKFVLIDAPDVVVDARAHKMSKARGNVVNPDDIIERYGADALRVFEMFMGPLEAVKPWATDGVVGVRRFLDRAWNVCVAAEGEGPLDDESLRLLHKTVQKVGADIEGLRFNTAISAMMILVNRLAEIEKVPVSAARTLALLLSPFAPHLGEELWERLGGEASLAHEPWPTFEPSLVVDDVVEIPIQVNGKLRAKARLRRDASEADARAAVAGAAEAQPFLAGKTEKKFLFVPGKIINVVVG
ncbi:MAG: leucine--tRNA ligase [Myxococcales bacterium]|nr:leucine--tRNA ligase [Myxococcales bacterium]